MMRRGMMTLLMAVALRFSRAVTFASRPEELEG
jgi:hypothetical protein